MAGRSCHSSGGGCHLSRIGGTQPRCLLIPLGNVAEQPCEHPEPTRTKGGHARHSPGGVSAIPQDGGGKARRICSATHQKSPDTCRSALRRWPVYGSTIGTRESNLGRR